MNLSTFWEKGFAEGYAEGHAEGYAEGYAEGFRLGLTVGLRVALGADKFIENIKTLDLAALSELEQKLVPGVQLQDLL